MPGLLSMLGGPAQATPYGKLLGQSYDPDAERAAGFSQAMYNISNSLLNPVRHRGTLGDIGAAAAAGGQGYKAGKTSYLKEAADREIKTRELERQNRALQKETEHDTAMADFLAANPQYKDFANAYPEQFGQFWQKKLMGEEELLPGQGKTGSTAKMGKELVYSWNNKTEKWEGYQLGDDGSKKKVELSPDEELAGPGAGEVRGKKQKSYDEMQNAVTTSLTNISEVPALIQDIRDNPDLETWGTGYAGVALSSLPETTAQAIKMRTDQLKSISLFTKIPELKGMGALSNIEGDTATKAMNRMDTATSYEEYMSALNDYEAVMGRMFERNQKMAASGNWDQMDEIRRQNNSELKFNKSLQRPKDVPLDEWRKLTREEKLEIIQASEGAE